MRSVAAPRRILFRLVLAIAFAALTGCDEYIEQATVGPDGSVEFAARAVVVCTDELQQELWGGDPCPTIDAALRGGDVGVLPFDYPFDPDRVALVGDGEQDRRRLDVSWTGTIDEFSTLLISSAVVTEIDENRTELVLTTSGAIADEVDEDRARWPAGEFRFVSPDLVVEHNGDRIQGRIVIWEIDDDRPDELRVVWTASEPERRIWWFVIAGVLVSAILAMMVFIEGPRRRT